VQQQSNLYIIVFSAIITIVLGGLLAMANQLLKPRQQRSVELDTKKQILSAVVDIQGVKGKELLDMYQNTIEGIVVDINGDVVEKTEQGDPATAEDIDVGKNYKKVPENRLYPIFKYHEAGAPEDVKAYILPVYGKGLWGDIWGFVALDTDINTMKGASFAHDSETPGLGARITSGEIQDRYEGKKIYDANGNLISVSMLKGESNPSELLDEHHIDGMSGATITANGVNDMLKNYFGYYSAFFKKASSNSRKMALK